MARDATGRRGDLRSPFLGEGKERVRASGSVMHRPLPATAGTRATHRACNLRGSLSPQATRLSPGSQTATQGRPRARCQTCSSHLSLARTPDHGISLQVFLPARLLAPALPPRGTRRAHLGRRLRGSLPPEANQPSAYTRPVVPIALRGVNRTCLPRQTPGRTATPQAHRLES